MKSADRYSLLPSHKLVLEGLIWIILVTIAWWGTLSTIRWELAPAIIYTSVLSIAAGVRVFFGHGLGTITATGLFGLSSAIFIGYSGLILVGQPSVQAGWESLALACVVGLTVQVATSALAWGNARKFEREPFWANKLIFVWMSRAGMVFLVLAMIAHLAVPRMRSWTEAAAFTAICVLSSGLMFREKVRIISWQTLIVIGSLVLYSEFFHSGSGRLRIAALACAVAVIVSARFPIRRLKVAIVALIPFVLAWMANDRLALQESLSVGASQGRTGLESMIAPLNVLALLLRALQDHDFTPALGYNLLSVFAILIPESVWPNQPRALGYELVQFVAPEKYADGIFSTAATSTGEGIFNFGWLGIALVIVFAAFVLRRLDSSMLRHLNAANPTISGILGFVLVAMLAGAVADYTWSGVHTYVARMITRLPVLLVLLVLAWFSDPIRRSFVSSRTPVSKHGGLLEMR